MKFERVQRLGGSQSQAGLVFVMCRCSNLETNVTAKTTDSHQRCLWTRLVHFVCRVSFETDEKHLMEHVSELVVEMAAKSRAVASPRRKVVGMPCNITDCSFAFSGDAPCCRVSH